ncbi:MAG: MBL fold metallo-hydrolase [Candidatus Omnitrophica bacterium]|nr:MBL fold metallo-hydrolase [Candidatus Omnitrophota bacterium]
MEIKVVFNNDVINNSFCSGWGFSCLVDGSILFDTGEKAQYLFNNAGLMGIDISAVEAIVISHDHWDHTGGLWDLLKKRKSLPVYSCPGFSREFKNKVVKAGGILKEANEFVQVAENIYVTGEIAGWYKGSYMPEQALVVKTDSGLTLITGCSHPGILRIIERVKEEFSGEVIKLAFGGFHLMDKDKREIRLIVEKLIDMGVKNVGPTHCTGYEAQMVFKQNYGDNYISVKAGQMFGV